VATVRRGGDSVNRQEECLIREGLELEHDKSVKLLKVESEIAAETEKGVLKVYRVVYRLTDEPNRERIHFFHGLDGRPALDEEMSDEPPDRPNWREEAKKNRRAYDLYRKIHQP
jgi:hypothetical protein